MPKGRIQNEDIKSMQELIDAGGFPQQLPNDNKIWLSARDLAKTLEQAILDGELLKGPTVVDLLDASLTSLPATDATLVDGETIVTGDIVLFTALSNPLENNRIYSAEVNAGNITWTLVKLNQHEDGDPLAGDFVFVTRGSEQFKLFYYTTLWEEFKSGGSGGGTTLLGGGFFKWDLSIGAPATVAENTTAPQNIAQFDGANDAFGQGFVPTFTGLITEVDLLLWLVQGAPDADFFVEIWTADTVTRQPISLLGTSNLKHSSTITGSPSFGNIFTFPTSVPVSLGGAYYVIVKTTNVVLLNGTNRVLWRGDFGNPYNPPEFQAHFINSGDGGSTWGTGNTNHDMGFSVTAIPSITEFSFENDIYLEQPGLNYSDNTISLLSSPVSLSNDKDVAYVIPNEDLGSSGIIAQSSFAGAGTQTIDSLSDWRAQTINLSQSAFLTEMLISLYKLGTPTGNMILEVYTDGGSAPADLVGVSDPVDITTLSTSSSATQLFTFSSPVGVLANQIYWIVLRSEAGAVLDGSNNVKYTENNLDVYPGGAEFISTNGGSTWGIAGANYDLRFQLTGITPGPLEVFVNTLPNVPDEGIIIARRDGDEVIISSTRLRPGQSKKLYSEDSPRSFDVPNNSAAVDITGLAFDSNQTSSAIINYEIYRRTDDFEFSETGQIRVMYKPDAAAWQIDRDFSFDDTGCTITITPAGQLQIATTDITGLDYLGRMQWDIADKPAA